MVAHHRLRPPALAARGRALLHPDRPGLQLQGRPHRLDPRPRGSAEGARRQVRPQAVPRSAEGRRDAADDPRTAHQGAQPSVTMADTTDLPGGVVHDLPEDLASALPLIRRRSPPGTTSRRWPATNGSAGSNPPRNRKPGASASNGAARASRRQAAPLLLARLQASLSAAPNPLSPPPGSTPAADSRWR